MSLTGKLLNRNGKLFVLVENRHDSEPKITYLWYLVTQTKGNIFHGIRPEPSDTATYRSGTGEWSTFRSDTHATSGSVWTEGKAQMAETVSAPSPKVRANIETRWHQGRWQKYLKSKGWIDIYMERSPDQPASC